MKSSYLLSALSLSFILTLNACASDRIKVAPQTDNSRAAEQQAASKAAMIGLEQDFDPDYKAPVTTEEVVSEKQVRKTVAPQKTRTPKSVDNSSTVLSVQGYGDNKADAKREALAELSRMVLSKVDSSFSKKQRVTNDSAELEVETGLTIDSKIIFQDVQTSQARKEGKEYIVDASLSANAMDATITYLLNDIKGDHTGYTRAQLKEIGEKIGFIYALSHFTNKYQGQYKKASLVAQADEFKAFNNKELNYARLIIISEAKITIDGKNFKTGQSTFLKPETYKYTATQNGCVKENGKVYLYKGQLTKKNIKLVCETSGSKNVALFCDEDYVVNFKGVLNKYGYVIDPEGGTKMELHVKELSKVKVDGDYYYNYLATFTLTKDGKMISKKAKVKNITRNQLPNKMERLIPALVKKSLQEF